jgi:hypothetical protein
MNTQLKSAKGSAVKPIRSPQLNHVGFDKRWPVGTEISWRPISMWCQGPSNTMSRREPVQIRMNAVWGD